MDEEKRSSWTSLKNESVKRFPKRINANALGEALKKFEALKRRNRAYKEYFDEVRELQKILPSELHGELSIRLKNGLDDKTVRAVTGGIIGSRHMSLEETIDIIQGITVGDEEQIWKHTPVVEDKYVGMDARDRFFAEQMEQNANLIRSVIKLSNAPKSAPSGPTHRNQGAQYSQQGPQNPGNNQQSQGNGESSAKPQYPRGNESSTTGGYFRRTNVKCYRCGEDGHFSKDCSNPAASYGDQQKWRKEGAERAAAFANRNDNANATGANTTPLGSRSQEVSAHQVEEWDEDYGLTNATRTALGDFDLGDEDMFIADVNNCECDAHRAQEWQDHEVYAVKRKAPHGASDDEGTENTSPSSTPPPKKKDSQTHSLPRAIERATEKRKASTASTPYVPPDNEQPAQSTPKVDSERNIPDGAQFLAPHIKKTNNSASRRPRGALPAQKPRGMGKQDPWSASDFLQNTMVNISMAQFVHIAPKARASLAQALQLEPKPESKAAKKKGKGVSFIEVDQAE